ncbi:DUF3800 domain-containing protein [Natronocalculus amylovorans]|uniref:DUF3800 domain-containing protein n=1 Tax=Natronocalculus amylovorans TaxID=2917812 RepID=A0AAE3KDM4_9EURY|nr:DUF3800 domain-containing protein [Natronocalculus amylovorans]MCL9818384.1 DUF3800 domain-containing protein [Natronocalculus amylovorans]
MATLHVFIDESGQHHKGEHYTLAACWAVSNYDNNNSDGVLDPTKQRLLSQIDHNYSELKGQRLDHGDYQWVISNIESLSYKDNTVFTSPSLWRSASPIQASFHDLQPDVAVASIQSLVGKGRDSKNSVHLLALVSVLSPIFKPHIQSAAEIDNIRITLDGNIWTQAAGAFESGLKSAGYSGHPITVVTADSKQYPGIQFADLFAYVWRQNKIDGQYSDLIKQVESLIINRP